MSTIRETMLRKFFLSISHRMWLLRGADYYAKKIGLRAQGRLFFYGVRPGAFGSEPWLITLGDNVHIVSGTQFITHDGGTLVLRHRDPGLELTAPITVGNNVYFGRDALIMPGVSIGDDVIIGARAVVTKDVASGLVVAGIPARPIRTIEEYFQSAKEKSLGLGHLSGAEKDRALRKHFSQQNAGSF